MKNANVVCRLYTRKAAENAFLEAVNKTFDPTLVSLTVMRSLPLLGGFADAFLTAILVDRVDKALRQKK